MTTLIVPAAGESSRYGLSRPKYLLQHPLGLSMLSHSILGLLSPKRLHIERIVVVVRLEHFEEISLELLKQELTELENFAGVVEILPLDFSTRSMVETISLAIERMDIKGSIIVKDCDNFVTPASTKIDWSGENWVCFANLQEFPAVSAQNKAYLDISNRGYVIGAFEKRISSPTISVGTIHFSSASAFMQIASELLQEQETYVSDIVELMIRAGEVFRAVEVESYSDWGTLSDWLEYVSTFGTVFVDLDGVMAQNNNPLSKEHGWNELSFLPRNKETLLRLLKSGRVSLVFCTSRSEKHRESVERGLRDAGFPVEQLIMGLPHAKRILVNDFARTNPFPSAIAINLQRDDDNLSPYLPPRLGELL